VGRVGGLEQAEPHAPVVAVEDLLDPVLLADGDVGLFVALSGFTKDADHEARQSHRRISLIDARRLLELWTTHYGQLDDSARARLPLKPVWFLASDD
jgi:restriction system protein